jgi:hypothetical protein
LFVFLFVGGFGVKKMLTILADILRSGGAKVCKSCRSRQELSNEFLLAKIGVDTAENELLKVWRKIQFIIHSLPYFQAPGVVASDA